MQNLNRYIDHTLLKADATPAQIETLCAEALQYHFASVCVNSCYVPLCAKLLKGSDVAVCCVAGFPLGAMLTQGKAAETAQAVQNGAQEVDMVINVGRAKAGDWAYVEEDIRAVVQAAGSAHVKVIIEACLLTDAEKVQACECAVRAGAAFVKTSTGFSTGGATAADVALMRRTVGPSIGVKAAGGVRTREDALAMLQAGANRLGASAGIAIIQE
ncbi:MAG: deoxyribose-phosphate aldolase [Christensenellaceae bacterium]|jgi:deoxyribose-phosphate aldolase|nr:deoxyribose-phosphate aldolase [Christensenellaceae bacterium]